jgi:predicted PurR-regulated permease PerM
MKDVNNTTEQRYFTKKLIEATIRLVVLTLIIGWCFAILQPFIIIVAWGLILAVAMFPLYEFLKKVFKGKKKLASIVVTLVLLSVIFTPAAFITKSMVTNIGIAKEMIQSDAAIIPPPDASVKEWPVIGKSTYAFWYEASTQLDKLIVDLGPQLKTIGLWLLDNISSAGFGFLQFILSIIISGIMLTYADQGHKAADSIGIRLIGERGKEFIQDAIITIRNVARGILGVAFLQAVLFGLGLVVAGVPFAGIWSVVCLILAIVQLGLGPLIIPISIYMFMTGDVLTAILLTVWMVFISLFDNVVKPIVMGRKAPVPTLVIFLGAIGGFMLNGIIGLFIGAVVLSLGYKMFQWWLKMESSETENLTVK